MVEHTPLAGADSEPGAKTGLGSSSSGGLAFALHEIKLHETSDVRDFERLMLTEVFPTVNTQEPDVQDMGPDQHFLLDGGSDGQYVWMIRIEYFMHHTPSPTWLHNRVEKSVSAVKDKIEPFGTLVSTRLLYDVERWRRRLGLE